MSEARSRRGEAGLRVPTLADLPIRAATFLGAAGIILYLALRGGAYDVVVGQEASLVCWSLLALGFLFGILPRAEAPRAIRLPLIAASVLALWTAVSVGWTASDARATEELAKLVGYLGFAVLVFATLDRRTWKVAAPGLAGAAAVGCGVAMASRLDPGSLHPSAAFVDAFGTKRLAYPLGYWNAVGELGAMTLAMMLSWSVHALTRTARSAALGLAPLAGAVVYLTYSRTAVIGAAIGVAAVCVLSADRRAARENTIAAALGIAVVVLTIRSQPGIASGADGQGAAIVLAALAIAAAGCAQAAFLAPVRRSIDPIAPAPRYRARRVGVALNLILIGAFLVALAGSSGGSSPPPAGGAHASPAPGAGTSASRLTSARGPRLDLWSTGLRAFAAHPIQGLGAGGYEFYWDRTTTKEDPIRDAHSVVITSVAELGLPGGIAILALGGGLAALCVQARRRARSASSAGAVTAMCAAALVFAVSAAVDWTYQIPAITALGIGAVCVAGASLQRDRSSPVRGRRGSWGLACVAVVAAAIQVPGIVSTSLVRSSQQHVEGGDLRNAANLARAASTAEPWAALPRLQEAIVALKSGHPDAAAAAARLAVDREPENYQLRLDLAQFQTQAGHTSAAIGSLNAARELRPALSGQISAAIRAISKGGSAP